jgi:hypothetical protein
VSTDYIIQTGAGKKGRSFTGTCVAVAVARGLDETATQVEALRPVWASFAGSDMALRPFVSNLRLGRKADPAGVHKPKPNQRLEFLKTSGYQVGWQREAEGSIATLFLPELVKLDPGMNDHLTIRFVMLVPQWWLWQQEAAMQRAEPAVQHLERAGKYPIERTTALELVPSASLFAAYLDRRTRCPIIADARFHLQLLCASLDAGMASFPGDDIQYQRYGSRGNVWGCSKHGFHAEGLELAGIRHAVAFLADREEFEEMLAEQTRIYLSKVR